MPLVTVIVSKWELIWAGNESTFDCGWVTEKRMFLAPKGSGSLDRVGSSRLFGAGMPNGTPNFLQEFQTCSVHVQFPLTSGTRSSAIDVIDNGWEAWLTPQTPLLWLASLKLTGEISDPNRSAFPRGTAQISKLVRSLKNYNGSIWSFGHFHKSCSAPIWHSNFHLFINEIAKDHALFRTLSLAKVIALFRY